MKLRREGKLSGARTTCAESGALPRVQYRYAQARSLVDPRRLKFFERKSAALVRKIILEPRLGNVDTHMPAGATPKA